MVKEITSVKEQPISKSIREKLQLPETLETEKIAKISIDSRKQLFVRIPSIITELGRISTKDKIKFKVSTPIPSIKKETKVEIQLLRD
jgi:hypothetical protein